MADDLVESVVASHILAEEEKVSGPVEEGRGVESAGAVEGLLGGEELGGEGQEQRGIGGLVEGHRWKISEDRFDRGFAADPAA